jgi:hypothetical protein
MEHQFFFISNYIYGGTVTFTAHLLHKLRKKNLSTIIGTFEKKKVGDFGYGLSYNSISSDHLDAIKKIFITDMYRNFHLLEKLKRKDITIVIHDPGEIFEENASYLKYWNIITVRKTVQDFLKRKHDIDARFLHHPFFPYQVAEDDHDHIIAGDEAVSISRIDYNKYIDIMLEANKISKRAIKIYGATNPLYVAKQLDGLNFDKYYHGKFPKSFVAVSKILSKAKFMIDLSVIPNHDDKGAQCTYLDDGGGAQYTYLEAIYNNTAIVLNRKWIEGVDKKYRDFKEGANCYAISNGKELAELLNSDVDTTKVIREAKTLMDRHIRADWAQVTV